MFALNSKHEAANSHTPPIQSDAPAKGSDHLQGIAEQLPNLTFTHKNESTPPLKKKVKVYCGKEGCTKIVGIVEQQKKCLCQKVFCPNHFFYLDHSCTADRKERDNERLRQSLSPSC